MRQAAGMLRRDEQRALMRWLNFLGPFWDDVRRHGPDDWFECDNKIVTDTAVGESGWLSLHEKIDCSLVSIDPSQWMTSPLSVVWVDNENRTRVEVPNFWDQETLKSALSNAPMTINSWEEMNESARIRYPGLTFANDWCEPLRGTPFVKSAAERVLSRLSVLHDLKGCFNANGERTSKGHDIYRTYFVGDRAWFTDSSDSEKSEFENELAFNHPAIDGQKLFCPWHGKVSTRTLRIHFSPGQIRASDPLYVVYVGPKLTKR